MSTLRSLRNIGKAMERKLQAVGITTAEELFSVGSKDAFLRMKIAFPEVCLVHLYTLEVAMMNVDFSALPEKTKADLKAFSDSLK